MSSFDLAKKVEAEKVFSLTLNALDNLISSLNKKPLLNLRQIKKYVKLLVDLIIADDKYLLEFTALKKNNNQFNLHCLKVTIYSLCLGEYIGITTNELEILGLTAMMHDMKKLCAIASGDLQKEHSLKLHQKTYDKDSLEDLLKIFKHLPTNDDGLSIMLTNLEQEIKIDPFKKHQEDLEQEPELYSRIIAIADTFDTYVKDHNSFLKNHSPETALQMLYNRQTDEVDKILTKLFIHVVGIYPPGTLLLLDNNYIALVTSKDKNNLNRPDVKIIGENGKWYQHGKRESLSVKDSNSNRYLREISKTFTAREIDQDTDRFITETC